MEPLCMVFIELLHISHLEKPIIEITDIIIPHAGATFLHNALDAGIVYEMVANVPHDFYENYLIHAWENFRIHQVSHRQLNKTLVEIQLLFHRQSYILQVMVIPVMKPVGNKVIAV